MPDTFKYEAFGADHYRPVSQFPHLKTSYGNLYYACNACNARKGDHWPKAGSNADGETIPNPCDHVMTKHLRFKSELVEPQSAAGEFTVRLLDLNRPAEVQIRETIRHSIRLSASELENVRVAIRDVQKRRKAGTLPSEAADVALGKLEQLQQRALKTLKDFGVAG